MHEAFHFTSLLRFRVGELIQNSIFASLRQKLICYQANFGQNQPLNISHSSFSIGVLPIDLPKKIFSILSELIKRKVGSIRSSRPNLKYPKVWVSFMYQFCVSFTEFTEGILNYIRKYGVLSFINVVLVSLNSLGVFLTKFENKKLTWK